MTTDQQKTIDQVLFNYLDTVIQIGLEPKMTDVEPFKPFISAEAMNRAEQFVITRSLTK